MSSLRPLLTISFLAMVGLFLYMKINETAPVIPEDAAEWDLSSDIQIGGTGFGAETAETSSQFGSEVTASADSPTSPYGNAPAYSANTMNEAPPAFTPATSTTAPPFQAQADPPIQAQADVAEEIDLTEEITAAEDTFPDEQIEASTAVAASAAAAVEDSMPELPDLPPATEQDISSTTEATAPRDSASEMDVDVAIETESAGPASSPPPFIATPQQEKVAAASTPETDRIAAAAAVAAAGTVAASNVNLGSRYGSVDVGSATEVAPSFDEQSPITPTETFPSAAQDAAAQTSLFAAARLNVQAALDRGQLSQALLLLSDWYGDPSLSAEESTEVETLLSQLAGSVIYSTEPRLEPPYMVQQGESLEDIAQKHNVPWKLLAKINGIADPAQLQPGQQLKVVRGPFSARVHLGQRKLILMLDRRYAGEFDLEFDPSITVEEGYWSVSQKLLTPAGTEGAGSEEHSILLTSTTPGVTQVAVLRNSANPVASGEDPNRVLKLDSRDVEDVYDILSLGSQVVIRR